MYFCSVCDKTYEDIREATDCCMDRLATSPNKELNEIAKE